MKWLALVLVLSTVSCGPNGRNSSGDDAQGSAIDGGGFGSDSGDDACSASAKLIYVVDQNNILAQFDPTVKTFTQLGTLSCPAGTSSLGDPATPFSMAVDRSAQAYVLYNDDKIYKVDTTQPSLPCTATSWSSQDGLQEFGMGYSTDMAGGTTDTLYIAGGADLVTGSGPATTTFATVDTSAFTATGVGTVHGWPELTGNSNAELWGFFPDVNDDGTTPTLVQIDKATGNATTTYMEPSLDGEPTAWAFGFYGGDYFVFLQKDAETSSTVYEIAGPTNTTTTPGSVVGTTSAGSLVIVGAGVSTCAPTVIF